MGWTKLVGARGKIIASSAHFLVVERSTINTYITRTAYSSFAADISQGCSLQFTHFILDIDLSRWQTARSIWTLARYNPVIPSVAYPMNDDFSIQYRRFTIPCILIHLIIRQQPFDLSVLRWSIHILLRLIMPYVASWFPTTLSMPIGSLSFFIC